MIVRPFRRSGEYPASSKFHHAGAKRATLRSLPSLHSNDYWTQATSRARHECQPLRRPRGHRLLQSLPCPARPDGARPSPPNSYVMDGIIVLMQRHFLHHSGGLLQAFPDRLGNFIRLPKSDANFAIVISGNDQGAKAKPPATFHDFGAAVDKHRSYQIACRFRRQTLVTSNDVPAVASAAAVWLCRMVF